MDQSKAKVLDENEITQKIYQDAETILGCAVEIENLIDYFQGKEHQTLIEIGLNRLFSFFNQSNSFHLQIKQQIDTIQSVKQQVNVIKIECRSLTLEVLKNITFNRIIETLNYFIDKNLAEFNVAFQITLLQITHSQLYSKELISKIFQNEEQISTNFKTRNQNQRRSITLQQYQQPTMKDLILEKIRFRSANMLSNLKQRFPKIQNLEGILPYIFGLYIFIDSEGLQGNFINQKSKLQSMEKYTIQQNLSNFQTLLQCQELKLLITYDLNNFLYGQFEKQTPINLTNIIQSKQWLHYDRLLIQQILLSQNTSENDYLAQSLYINQTKEMSKRIMEKLLQILILVNLYENGDFQNNFNQIESFLNDLENQITNLFNDDSLNKIVKISIKTILQQLIIMLDKLFLQFKSKTAITITLRLKIFLQNKFKQLNFPEQKNLHQISFITRFEQDLSKFYKKIIVFEISNLTARLLQSNHSQVEFDDILPTLKYHNNPQLIKQELNQLREILQNSIIKSFLSLILDYIDDKIRKASVILNHNEVSLETSDKEILRCVNDDVFLNFIEENGLFFKSICHYIQSNDAFLHLKLNAQCNVKNAIEIAALAILFKKGSTLHQFFLLFLDFSFNRAQKQIRLQNVLKQEEQKEWNELLQKIL